MPRKKQHPFQGIGGNEASYGLSILRKDFRGALQLADMSLWLLQRVDRKLRNKADRLPEDPFEVECSFHMTEALNAMAKANNELAWVRRAIELPLKKKGGIEIARRVLEMRRNDRIAAEGEQGEESTG